MTANGQLPANQLVTWRGVPLAPQTATDAERLRVAAAAAGFTIEPVRSNGAAGYRSLGMQVDMHVHPSSYGLLPSPPAPAQAPVGASRHGQGRALDIAGAAAGSPLRAWLLANGSKYGWASWRLDDPNHFEHGVGDVVTITESGLAPASSGNPTPVQNAPTYDEDDDMKIITTSAEVTSAACPDNPSGSDVQWLIDKQFIQRSGDPTSSATGQNLYGTGPENTHPLSLAGFQNTLWNHGVSPLVVARLKPGQAWSVERGIFNPGDDIPGNAKP